MDELKQEIKALIIEALMIEDMEPTEIEDDMPLFIEGLGLDSVDALEVAVELERVYGVQFPEASKSRQIFKNVESLAAYVQQQRSK